MLKRTLLLSCAATLSIAAPAWAETSPCKMINQLLYSASLLKQIETEPQSQKPSDTARKLSRVIDNISLDSLIPPSSQSSFSYEHASLLKYVSYARESATKSPTRQEGGDQTEFRTALSPELSKSLQTLEAHWQCRPALNAQPSLTEGRAGAATFGGGTLSGVIQSKTQIANAAPQTSKPARHFSGGGTVLGQAQLDGVMPKASFQLFLLILLTATIMGGIYWQKRTIRHQVREHRRILNTATEIKLGTQSYQVVMVDISRNGFKIQHPSIIEQSQNLYVRLADLWFPGQIKWHNKLYAGVKFKEPLDTETFNGFLESLT